MASNKAQVTKKVKIQLQMLTWLQFCGTRLEFLFYPVLRLLLKWRHTHYHVVSRKQEHSNKKAFPLNKIATILKNGLDIKIAVGEMGHRLMEHPQLIASLKHAYEHNNAHIEIIHGPRVDPKTQKIFELAEKDIVHLFKTLKYYPHHFMLVTLFTGEIILIDEGIHAETHWGGTSPSANELFTSRIRLYYITKYAKRRVLYLQDEFERRKQSAYLITKHPYLKESQSPFRFGDFFSWHFISKRFLQLGAIFFDEAFDMASWQSLATPKNFVARDEVTNKPIPKWAIAWLDSQREQMGDQAQKSHLWSTYQQIEMLAIQLQLPKYSIRTFRDLHFLKCPEKSIAALNIDDDLFWHLIWQDIDSVQMLEAYLANGDALNKSLQWTMGENSQQAIEKVKKALAAWHCL